MTTAILATEKYLQIISTPGEMTLIKIKTCVN